LYGKKRLDHHHHHLLFFDTLPWIRILFHQLYQEKEHPGKETIKGVKYEIEVGIKVQ